MISGRGETILTLFKDYTLEQIFDMIVTFETRDMTFEEQQAYCQRKIEALEVGIDRNKLHLEEIG